MNKVSTYLLSLIMTILLIIAMTASTAMVIADINVTEKKASAISSKGNIPAKIVTQLDKYYRSKAGATGIPANVYMDSISEGYISSAVDSCLAGTFSSLKENKSFSASIPENKALEDSINKFFNDYADQSGYEKDDAFYKKLDTTKSAAYKVIGDYCDIYKAASLSKHGVMGKASKLYRLRPLLTFASVGGVVLLILFIAAVNRKDKKTILYWTGISALISGIFGTLPSAYLLGVKYFDSFSIKQPQVFSAYTRSMYGLTNAFLAASIAMLVLGIAMVVLYGVFCGMTHKAAAVQDIASPAPENIEKSQ